MNARQRISFLTDRDSFAELVSEVESEDILGFPGYAKKLESIRESAKEREAVVCGQASIGGQPCALFVMEPYFMMGSMGTAVGRKDHPVV
jgi:acetyl-CoA carboxylase carboxyl transferase subunit beta